MNPQPGPSLRRRRRRRTTERFGALAERDFRLVFVSTTISAAGTGVAAIALVFAVLAISHNSTTAVGVVLACRQIAAAGVTLAAGVLSDRLPRHLVLVAIAAIQAVVQGVVAVLLLAHAATVPLLAVLAVVYGIADGFEIPAVQGLIPAVVSGARLQQANAVIGLSRSILAVAAPILGGALVVAGTPGTAILIDAISFAAAAILLAGVKVSPRETLERQQFLQELREGWYEVRKRTWVWTAFLLSGISNLASQWYNVLAPLVMKQHYSGAISYGALLSVYGAGAVTGGFVSLRWKPKRPFLISCVATVATPIGYGLLAFHAPLEALLALQLLGGIGLAIHLTLWYTVFQQHIPERARARVSSFDVFGSFILVPLGTVVAGPLAGSVGAKATLLAAATIMLATKVILVVQPSIWAIRDAPESAPSAA